MLSFLFLFSAYATIVDEAIVDYKHPCGQPLYCNQSAAKPEEMSPIYGTMRAHGRAPLIHQYTSTCEQIIHMNLGTLDSKKVPSVFKEIPLAPQTTIYFNAISTNLEILKGFLTPEDLAYALKPHYFVAYDAPWEGNENFQKYSKNFQVNAAILTPEGKSIPFKEEALQPLLAKAHVSPHSGALYSGKNDIVCSPNNLILKDSEDFGFQKDISKSYALFSYVETVDEKTATLKGALTLHWLLKLEHKDQIHTYIPFLKTVKGFFEGTEMMFGPQEQSLIASSKTLLDLLK